LECLPVRSGHVVSEHQRELLFGENRLLRLKFIAAEADVSVKTVRRWIDLHGLPSQKLGGLRVVREWDFLEFIEKERTKRK
jgi:hypothetical protein